MEIHESPIRIRGRIIASLYRDDGTLKARSITNNLVTAVGDQYFVGRAVLSSGLPAQVTCMKLGTSNTAPAKTGAGAALVTYATGSNRAIDGGFPTASAGVVTWQTTWGAGIATGIIPAEVVLVTDASADATSTVANTIARGLITGLPTKQASDILVIVWPQTLLGA